MSTKYWCIIVSLCAFLSIAMSAHAAYVEIGAGTGATRNVPLNGHYNYSWSGSIYLAGEINSAMTIESLSYNVDTSTATSFTLNNQRIYLAHTTATTFTSNAYVDPVAAGYTLVYQGTVTLIPGEWNTIALDTVFDYNGADNLLIYWINESLTAYTPYPEFCYTNQTDRVVYATNNSELPATGNINYLLPNIRLHYFESITEFPYETTFSVFPPTYWDMTGGTCNWAQCNNGALHCAYAHYWGWNESETAYMTTPKIVLPQNPMLGFYWSHHYNYNYPYDALTVQVSTNEGASWTNVWYRGGNTLDSGDGAGNEYPGDMSTLATVDLAAYSGNTVLIRFYGYSGFGPDLFIDNVCVYNTADTPNSVNPASPADGAANVLTSGNLQWERTGPATGYTLYLGTDNPPTNIVNGADLGSSVSYAYSGLSINTTYYWQVVPYNANGNATGCPVWSFTSQAFPEPSEAVNPLDEYIYIPISGTMEWTEAAGATGYRLYLGTDNPPTNVINGIDVGNVQTYDYTGLTPGALHRWKIVPFNEHGEAVGCDVWTFTTLAVPAAAGIWGPLNGAIYTPESRTLIWQEVFHATGYLLYLGTDNPPTNIVNGADLGNQNYYEYAMLNLGTTYYWQVVPYNSSGVASSSPVWNFTTSNTDSNTGTDGTYYYANSIAPDATSRPTYNWKDTTGHTELTLPVQNGNYDDGNWLVTLPFTFPFYGVSQNSLYITTNGLLSFDATTAYNSIEIPNNATPNNIIAPLWNDFEYDADARILYGGDATSGFTVTYWHLPCPAHNEYYISMQTTLFPDGKIIICYNRDESTRTLGTSYGYSYGSSIGIENYIGTLGVQYQYGISPSVVLGGPIFDPENGNLALAFGLNQNDLDWPAAVLASPQNIVISMTASGAELTWDAVDGAYSYYVYACGTPNGVFVPLACVTSTTYTHASSAEKCFYMVTASSDVPTRGAEPSEKQTAE